MLYCEACVKSMTAIPTAVTTKMATNGEGTSSAINQNTENSDPSDRLKGLYPAVNEDETPLPRTWNPRTKSTFIGLSQNNLRLHYKGRLMTITVKTFPDDSPQHSHKHCIVTRFGSGQPQHHNNTLPGQCRCSAQTVDWLLLNSTSQITTLNREFTSLDHNQSHCHTPSTYFNSDFN